MNSSLLSPVLEIRSAVPRYHPLVPEHHSTVPDTMSPVVMSFELPYNRLLHYGGMPHLTDPTNHFQTIDPSTGKPIGDIQAASPADVDAAIQAAEKAFPSWSTTPAIQRSRILHRAATLLRAMNDEIAKAETHDTGKPFSETATVDVVTGADVLEYYANLVGGGGLNGETVQLREGVWCYTTKEPLGVCAGIGAWNYPIQMYASVTPIA